jgi:hypothetical protein
MCLAPTEILKYKNFLKYHTTTAKGLVSLEPWTRPQNFATIVTRQQKPTAYVPHSSREKETSKPSWMVMHDQLGL